jgi:hypothetical protein
MYELSKTIYTRKHPLTAFPDEPDEAYKQVVIRAALEEAYEALPPRDGIVDVAKQQLQQAIDFVIERDIVEMPEEPVEIIVMPEFQRGVSLAYLDPPGPLDRNQPAFYAVAPLPEDWTDDQVESFLREYNLYSIQDLTMHEAVPGHYLQLAHSNRYPSILRSVLWSGSFVEGWAAYAEQVMIEAGYQDNDPLQKLIMLKWYLRVITNAIIDSAIHVDGMTRDEAMKLMVEGGFQEEREAAGKWVRAQLTSAQLSTYFVGYQEHVARPQKKPGATSSAIGVTMTPPCLLAHRPSNTCVPCSSKNPSRTGKTRVLFQMGITHLRCACLACNENATVRI